MSIEKLPPELLARVISMVNSSELAAVRHARRQGKIRARKMIRNVRLVCHAFARIAAPYLFAPCAVTVFPNQERLREFCQLAKSYIGPHVRRCIFRADESLLQFPADKFHVALMNSAAAHVRNFTYLETMEMDFLPSPCCRASGAQWIAERPHVAVRMWTNMPQSVMPNFDSLVFNMSAEEFFAFARIIEPHTNKMRGRLRHISFTFDMMNEARYVASPAPIVNTAGGYSVPNGGVRMEYIPESRYEDDEGFVRLIGQVLSQCIPLRTLQLSLPNSELISPHVFSEALRGIHLPHLTHFALGQAPMHVSAVVAFLARHEGTLRRAAFFDLELRADRQKPPAALSHAPTRPSPLRQSTVNADDEQRSPDITLPWVALNAWFAALPTIRCTIAVHAPLSWRSVPSQAELFAIGALEHMALARACEDEMTEKNLRDEWTFRHVDQVCVNCTRNWTRVEIPTTEAVRRGWDNT